MYIHLVFLLSSQDCAASLDRNSCHQFDSPPCSGGRFVFHSVRHGVPSTERIITPPRREVAQQKSRGAEEDRSRILRGWVSNFAGEAGPGFCWKLRAVLAWGCGLWRGVPIDANRRGTRLFAKMSFRRGGSHAPVHFPVSGLQQRILENPDNLGV